MVYAEVMKTGSGPAAYLETLRLARGLTQAQLAEVSGLSQATLSKAESGTSTLDAAKWAALADALGVPHDAFDRALDAAEPAQVFHRRRKAASKTTLTRIAAELTLLRMRVQALGLDAQPALSRHDLEDGFVLPEEIARTVRQELGLGDEPIEDLTAVLENAGVIVMRWPLESVQVDAIAGWPNGGSPVILVGDHVPAERLRFTMAHELGHAVLHRDEADASQEREADAFAAEFLMPRSRLREEWPGSHDLPALTRMKRQWGISLSALIRRAHDEGLLDDREYRQWNIHLASSGMHRREPEPLEPESPRALRRHINAELERGASVRELSARARMYESEFERLFLEETT